LKRRRRKKWEGVVGLCRRPVEEGSRQELSTATARVSERLGDEGKRKEKREKRR
jgi:hypothetical protein